MMEVLIPSVLRVNPMSVLQAPKDPKDCPDTDICSNHRVPFFVVIYF